jgi:hypothetical protein
LIHVHPDELTSISGIFSRSSATQDAQLITCKWSAGKSFQFARQSWAHAQELLGETVARIGGRLVVLSGEDSGHTDLHAVAQIGTLEVRAAS